MADWSIDRARRTYSVPHWSDGYFDIDAQGRAVARPQAERGPGIVIDEVVAAARAPRLLPRPLAQAPVANAARATR